MNAKIAFQKNIAAKTRTIEQFNIIETLSRLKCIGKWKLIDHKKFTKNNQNSKNHHLCT